MSQQTLELDDPVSPATVDFFVQGLNDTKRAMSNHINRSSLLAPSAHRKRIHHVRKTMVSRGGVEMIYTGEQLDEADADLLMLLLHLVHGSTLGKPVVVSRHYLLQTLGRKTGGKQYQWLHDRMMALAAGTLYIEVRSDGELKYRFGNMVAFHILQEFYFDEVSRKFAFVLDPRWATLFSNKEFALVDWAKRMRMGRQQDMAKALQRLVATSNTQTQRYPLGYLKEKMGFTSPIRKFRRSLIAATEELVRVEIIHSAEIVTNGNGDAQLNMHLSEPRLPHPKRRPGAHEHARAHQQVIDDDDDPSAMVTG